MKDLLKEAEEKIQNSTNETSSSSHDLQQGIIILDYHMMYVIVWTNLNVTTVVTSHAKQKQLGAIKMVLTSKVESML